MNVEVSLIFLALFWAIGAHHWVKHKELKGLNRFMQGRDILNVLWYIGKSHEGWQIIALLLAGASALF